jgi:hypothetical protein
VEILRLAHVDLTVTDLDLGFDPMSFKVERAHR